MSSTAHVCAPTGGLLASDPVVAREKEVPHPTPFESQNCGKARTASHDPLGIAVAADWFRARGIEVAPAAAPPLATVKV